jgi:hypothetical protein
LRCHHPKHAFKIFEIDHQVRPGKNYFLDTLISDLLISGKLYRHQIIFDAGIFMVVGNGCGRLRFRCAHGVKQFLHGRTSIRNDNHLVEVYEKRKLLI